MAGGQDPNDPQGNIDQTSQSTQGEITQTEGAAPPPQDEAKPDWRDRRIGEQQERLRQRNARIQELEAQLRQQGQPAQPPQGNGNVQQFPQQPVAPTGDIQRQINEAAAQLANAQEFTRRCNEVAEAGRRVYNNFDQRVTRLTGLVDPNDQIQVMHYNAFLNAAMETGQAARLIYDLGGDLNEASRIMAMEPVKMAVELTRLSARVSTTDQTGTPRPLQPLGSATNTNQRTLIQPDDPDQADNLPMSEWMKRREEQVASKRQRTLG